MKTCSSGRPGLSVLGCGRMTPVLLVGALLMVGGAIEKPAAASCEGLAKAIVPNGSITAAQSVPAGDYTAPSGIQTCQRSAE